MVVAAVSQTGSANPAVSAITRLRDDIGDSTYRLASGNRITRAGEDAPSVAVAATLQSQISGLRQGQLNGASATSLLQVAANALTNIASLLETLEGITTQADSGGLTDTNRVYLDTRFQSITQEIDRIAATTRFNGKPLLDGSFSPFSFTVGDSNSGVEVTINPADTATLFGGATPTIATGADAQTALPVVQQARETIGIALAEVTSNQAALAANEGSLANAIYDIDTARGALVNTDIPRESARYKALLIQQQVGVSVAAQTQFLNSGLLDLLRVQLTALND